MKLLDDCKAGKDGAGAGVVVVEVGKLELTLVPKLKLEEVLLPPPDAPKTKAAWGGAVGGAGARELATLPNVTTGAVVVGAVAAVVVVVLVADADRGTGAGAEEAGTPNPPNEDEGVGALVPKRVPGAGVVEVVEEDESVVGAAVLLLVDAAPKLKAGVPPDDGKPKVVGPDADGAGKVNVAELAGAVATSAAWVVDGGAVEAGGSEEGTPKVGIEVEGAVAGASLLSLSDERVFLLRGGGDDASFSLLEAGGPTVKGVAEVLGEDT